MEREKVDIDELNLRITRIGMVEKWGDFFLKKLRTRMRELKIGKSGDLQRSLKKELLIQQGDVRAVFVRFHLYGRFRDMGVGSGLKAYERGMNKLIKSGVKMGAKVSFVNREPARWFNKVKTAQIYKLRELLVQDLDHAVVKNIQNELQQITQYEVNM